VGGGNASCTCSGRWPVLEAEVHAVHELVYGLPGAVEAAPVADRHGGDREVLVTVGVGGRVGRNIIDGTASGADLEHVRPPAAQQGCEPGSQVTVQVDGQAGVGDGLLLPHVRGAGRERNVGVRGELASLAGEPGQPHEGTERARRGVCVIAGVDDGVLSERGSARAKVKEGRDLIGSGLDGGAPALEEVGWVVQLVRGDRLGDHRCRRCLDLDGGDDADVRPGTTHRPEQVLILGCRDRAHRSVGGDDQGNGFPFRLQAGRDKAPPE